MTDLNWPRLGSYVARRRVELGYSTTRDLANAMTAAGMQIHEKTLGRLERGESVNRNTLTKVEEFLGWSPGSAQAVLRGGEPTLATKTSGGADAARAATMAELHSMSPDQLARMHAQIAVISGQDFADEWLRKVVASRKATAPQGSSSPQTTRREVG